MSEEERRKEVWDNEIKQWKRERNVCVSWEKRKLVRIAEDQGHCCEFVWAKWNYYHRIVENPWEEPMNCRCDL
jgi:hypothetical protein